MKCKLAGFLGAFGAVLPTVAFSFSMLTADGAWHEKITREALAGRLQPKTLDQFAGAKKAMGAIGAPDVNAAFNDAAHCDNGDAFPASGYPQTPAAAQAKLDAGRGYLFASIEQAVKDAGRLVNAEGQIVSSQFPSVVSCTFAGDVKGRAKCDVLQNLGKAMHAAQDFYSHTNWVDRPGSGSTSAENPAGLGNAGASPYLAAPTAPFPLGLISGCFDSRSAQSKLAGDPAESKGCNYSGGMRVKHAFLNKDAPATPRAAIDGNFDRARAAAVEETQSKWALFEARIREVYPGRRGEVIVCAMTSDRASACK